MLLLLLHMVFMCSSDVCEELRPGLEEDDDWEEEEEAVLAPVLWATVGARLWRITVTLTSDRVGDRADSGKRRGRNTGFSLRVDVQDEDFF